MIEPAERHEAARFDVFLFFLVFGVLFFDRIREHPQHASLPLTLASLVVANLATVTAFGVLASSKVPVLADLGSTVAPGTLLALWFSALLARPPAPPDAAPTGGS